MKSIERFERIKKWAEGDMPYTNEKEIDEDIKEIHNSLEVLEIIKEKSVNMFVLKTTTKCNLYNFHILKYEEGKKLTQEEFDKVKNWFEGHKELEK